MKNEYVGEFPNPISAGKIIGPVNPVDYHRPDPALVRGNPQYPMSFSELSQFAVCPSRWIAGYREEENEVMQWGSLIDTLALTPEQFERRYAVTPETYRNEKGIDKPWRFGANATDAWKEDQLAAGLKIVKREHHAEATAAVKALLGDEEIASLIEASQRQVMVVAQYEHPEGKIVVPLKCLVDLLPRADDPKWGKCVADLKTCTNASPEPFIDHIYRMQYYAQAALYLDALRSTGEDRTDFLMVCQENFPPWQVGRRHLSAETVELGRTRYNGWLYRYAECLLTGHWGDYEAGQRCLLPRWAMVEFTKPWMLV